MGTYDVTIYPDTTIHIEVEAQSVEEAKSAANELFDADFDAHVRTVADGDWAIDDVEAIDGEEDDSATEATE